MRYSIHVISFFNNKEEISEVTRKKDFWFSQDLWYHYQKVRADQSKDSLVNVSKIHQNVQIPQVIKEEIILNNCFQSIRNTRYSIQQCVVIYTLFPSLPVQYL